MFNDEYYNKLDKMIAETVGFFNELAFKSDQIALTGFHPSDMTHMALFHIALISAALTHKQVYVKLNPFSYFKFRIQKKHIAKNAKMYKGGMTVDCEWLLNEITSRSANRQWIDWENMYEEYYMDKNGFDTINETDTQDVRG